MGLTIVRQHTAEPTAPGAQAYKFTLNQPKRTQRSSGNAAGSSEKQREATKNSLQLISNTLQRLASYRQKREGGFAPTGGTARAARRDPEGEEDFSLKSA